jgi:uncharacterized membrane protein YoaK (UPF0700 family)
MIPETIIISQTTVCYWQKQSLSSPFSTIMNTGRLFRASQQVFNIFSSYNETDLHAATGTEKAIIAYNRLN